MSHHHDHHHHHHHHEEASSQQKPSEIEKLTKVVEHWIHHNEEHARSYEEWARRAREMGQEQVALILEQVSRETALQNQNFEKALSLLKTRP